MDFSYFDYRLAPYAQKNKDSQGRPFPEPEAEDRLPFQRDRDRIIHTKAFRRLQGKTQVVSPHRGDHYRNRLTHTIEVAQISRDMARWLGLNEDLAEAIALGHDLGHPPFGHAGEHALKSKMKSVGLDFEHNQQSLRMVTIFEKRYPEFPGLNLTYEVLEGLQKHTLSFYHPRHGKIYFPHIESQLVDIADEITYLSADLEDGLRGDFFDFQDLKKVALPAEILKDQPALSSDLKTVFIRKVIKFLLKKLTQDTQKNVEKYEIKTQEDVQKNPTPIVMYEKDFYENFLELKRFLMKHYYSNPKIQEENEKGQQIIYTIFDTLAQDPKLLPSDFMPQTQDPFQRICDYIAGMTDAFAQKFVENIKASPKE